MLLQTARRLINIDINEILYFKSDGHYVSCCTTGSERSECLRIGIGAVEEQLKNSRFFRVHSRYLVNLCMIAELRGLTLILRNGAEIRMSRYRVKAVKEWLINYHLGQNTSIHDKGLDIFSGGG